MNPVFVDTAAWIALINDKDGLHSQARRVYTDLVRRKVSFVTTEFVFLEVADALSSPLMRLRTVAFLNRLREDLIEIIPVNSGLLDKAWSLYSRRPDKGWGLTDCTSFVVMGELGLTEAFTSDQHSIDLTPEMETRLQEEAVKHGQEPAVFALMALQHGLGLIAGQLGTEDALMIEWRGASHRSLQELWDNDEDAVYDKL